MSRVKKLSEAVILSLRRRGESIADIARRFGCGYFRVWQINDRLVARGKVARDRRGAPKRNLALHPEHPCFQTIVRLTNEGKTLREIGEALGGLTGERVRQIRKAMAAINGPAIFSPPSFLSEIKLAQKVGVSPSWLRQCRSRGLINPFYCSLLYSRKRNIRYRQADLPQLVATIKAERRRQLVFQCRICQRFFRKKNAALVKYCLNCKKQASRLRWQQLKRGMPPSQPERESVWRRWLRQRRRQRQAAGQWVELIEASRIAGLSKIIIIWLGYRRLVRVRPHPFKKWRGQPKKLYASNDVRQAGQLFRRWQKKQKKRPAEKRPGNN